MPPKALALCAKNIFHRVIFNQIYVSYVLPVLEYSAIVLNNYTAQNSNTLEKLQNEAARIVTELTSAASVAQLDAPSDWRPGGRGFNPRRGRQHSFVEIDHEIFSTVILSLPLIQEGQLSISGERRCTVLVNRLED